MENGKITEAAILGKLAKGAPLLAPLEIRSVKAPGAYDKGVDARLEAALPGGKERFRFAVEVKARSTPLAVRHAVGEARADCREGELPLVVAPFLGPERLKDLETAGVSGVDLCGNGVVVVPGRLYILRTGQPNRYTDSRPLQNPYRGRSAMVARMLLARPRWKSPGELRNAIVEAGSNLGLPQVSKALSAMTEDLIVTKDARGIVLQEPVRLLDSLGREWRREIPGKRVGLRIPLGTEWARELSSQRLLKWAMTGESSVGFYTTFAQGGPRKIAVNDLALAMKLVNGQPEPVPNFAKFEFIETDDDGFYFANEVDPRGERWASRVQTWLELQAGDARQQEAARELREQILRGAQL